jgi:hypothetical protein
MILESKLLKELAQPKDDGDETPAGSSGQEVVKRPKKRGIALVD